MSESLRLRVAQVGITRLVSDCVALAKKEGLERASTILQEEMARRRDVSDDNKSIANAAFLRLLEEIGSS